MALGVTHTLLVVDGYASKLKRVRRFKGRIQISTTELTVTGNLSLASTLRSAEVSTGERTLFNAYEIAAAFLAITRTAICTLHAAHLTSAGTATSDDHALFAWESICATQHVKGHVTQYVDLVAHAWTILLCHANAKMGGLCCASWTFPRAERMILLRNDK